MNWTGHTVLVTGAGGFVGSHLVEALVEHGAEVRAFVHYNSRNDPGLLARIQDGLLKNVEIVFGDLRDPSAIRQAVEGTSTVFHLAAVISIPYSYKNPYEVVETNFMGTLNVLEACREAGVERLVHTSSSEVYGSARDALIAESHQLHGQSPYAASKIGADKLAESFYCTYDLPVVTLRPFNAYGPRQSARAIVPTIITQALKSDSVNLGNIRPSRDFTYISDTVDGFLRIAEVPDIEGEVFNLGSGYDITIAELAHIIIRLVGRKVQIAEDKTRIRPPKSEVDKLIADSSFARRRLGWRPRVSLEEGISHTITWISENIDLYKVGNYQV